MYDSTDKSEMATSVHQRRRRHNRNSENENSEVILCKCDSGTCGKSLIPPYYISLTIPSNPYRRFTRECTSFQDEKNQEQSILFQIQSDLSKYSKRETKYQSLFSTKDLMRSKKRICADCQEKWNYDDNIGVLYGNHLRMAPIAFAVEEYRRRHPLETVTSQLERYLVSLPDRSKMLRDYFGDWLDDDDSGVRLAVFEGIIADYLMIALISDYDASELTDPRPEHYKLKLHELRTKFIKDRNRTCPNDQELTRWMQENINNGHEDHWFKIQYSKVFENPKKERITIKNVIDEVRATKYTVIVHFSSPNGYWLEYDI
jgi:hypothetical protein